MKKFAWIIALLAALSLGFFACTEPDGTAYGPPAREIVETEWVTVFDMQNAANGIIAHGIQELTPGDLTFPASGAGPIAPLVKAGNMPPADNHISSFKAVTVDGKIALEYVTVANWGPGFDLPISAFGFTEGDKITIEGTAAGGASINLALNVNQGSDQHITGNRITSAGAFTVTAELTAANLSEIQGNEQKVIRFEDRVGGTTVTITQITVEGERAATITTLPATTLSINGNTASWTPVQGALGYRVLAGTEVIDNAGASVTSTDLQIALNGKAAADYVITVVALGTAGSTRDSAASNAITYTFVPYSVDVAITVDGAPQTAKVILIGKTAKFEAITGGYKVTGGQNYGTSFPAIAYDFGTDDLSDIASIKFTATQVSGDVGYKRFRVSVADAADTASFKPVTRNDASGAWFKAAPATGTASGNVNLPVFSALVEDSGLGAKSNLVISLNPNVSSTAVYEITGIEITTGGNAPDEPLSGAFLALDIPTPLFGAVPTTSISKSDNDNPVYTGTIRWTPVTASGKFELLEVYTATVILTPAKTYSLPMSGYTVENGSVTVDSTNSKPKYVKMGVTFGMTEPLGTPGVVYSMATDATITAGGDLTGNAFLGFNNENSATLTITAEKTIKITDKGGPADSLIVKQTDVTADSKTYGLRHRVTVTGKVFDNGGTDGANQTPAGGKNQQIKFQQNFGPSYGQVNGDAGDVRSSSTDGTFTIIKTFTWAEWKAATGGHRVIVNSYPGDGKYDTEYLTVVVEAIAY